jgi:hypothetical protein
MDRPYQESIEGNEFIHALKGRCFWVIYIKFLSYK